MHLELRRDAGIPRSARRRVRARAAGNCSAAAVRHVAAPALAALRRARSRAAHIRAAGLRRIAAAAVQRSAATITNAAAVRAQRRTRLWHARARSALTRRARSAGAALDHATAAVHELPARDAFGGARPGSASSDAALVGSRCAARLACFAGSTGDRASASVGDRAAARARPRAGRGCAFRNRVRRLRGRRCRRCFSARWRFGWRFGR